jgi:hypothetical protein
MKRKQLNENETYIQLSGVEQKLRLHESNNFHLKDCKLASFLTQDIASKTAESNYQPITVDCRNLMADINLQLGKLMSQLPSSR